MPVNPSKSQPALYLVYHRVTPTEMPYKYSHSQDLFRDHMRALSDDLAPSSYDAVVTFDDGNRTQWENAVPVLAEFGVSAIFFITAAWTGVNPGSMNPRELKEISSAGHSIGAHGLTHKLLTHCSADELRHEVLGAKQRLEEILGRAVTAISMPGGRYNGRVLEACSAAGYTKVFTSDPIIDVRQEYGMSVIGRYNVRQTLSAKALVRLLDPSSGALRREQRRSEAKQLVQKIFGDDLYHRLWSVISKAQRKA